MHDPVNHPKHYTSSKACCSGCGKPIECIDITRHMNFNIGNVFKYLWRMGMKDSKLQEIKKAQWYLNDEVNRVHYELDFHEPAPYEQKENDK
jgi:hypothetical protein